MEDAHTTVLDLVPSTSDEAKNHASKISFFGVFDGHGGDKVALFAGQNIHEIVAKQETFKKGDYEQALKDGFLATDRAIINGKARNAYSLSSLPHHQAPLLLLRLAALVANRCGPPCKTMNA